MFAECIPWTWTTMQALTAFTALAVIGIITWAAVSAFNDDKE